MRFLTVQGQKQHSFRKPHSFTACGKLTPAGLQITPEAQLADPGLLRSPILTSLCSLVVLLAALVFSATAQAETSAPGWELTSTTFPTDLAPAGGTGVIEVNVYNVGGERSHSDDPVTVTDVLPAGVVATEAGDVQNAIIEEIGEENLWECTGNASGESPRKAGKFEPATVVTCTNNKETLPELPPPLAVDTVDEGAIEHIGIAVKVETTKAEMLTNYATITGGGAPASANTSAPITVSPTPASSFGFQGFDGWFSRAAGILDTQAGSHPYAISFSFDLNNILNPARGAHGELEPAGGQPRNLAVNLPPGFIGNPTAVPECTRQQFEEENCSPSSQIGVDVPEGPGGVLVPKHLNTPVYNLVPPPGVPAQFALIVAGVSAYLDAGVRSGGDYGITEHVDNLPEKQITGNRIIIWGEPSDPSHDEYRFSGFGAGGSCNPAIDKGKSGCTSSAPRVPFITLPTACEGPQEFETSSNTWETVAFGEASFKSHNSDDTETGFTGCAHLGFSPNISVAPDTTDSDTPAGLTVDVRVPQEGLVTPDALSTSNIKDTTVALPPGVVVNPGQAAGLQACDEGPTEETAPGEVKYPGRDNLPLAGENGETEAFSRPADCPAASQIGTVEIETPLLSKPLQGDVYIMQSNPPNLKLLVAPSGEGVNVKLIGEATLCQTAGEVIPGSAAESERTCAAAGQIITTFTKTPEVPFTNFKLTFSGGAQAALATPTECRDNTPEHPETYETATDFTPWSTPTVEDAFPASNFQISGGPDGSPCPSNPLPFSPGLNAGATTDAAGAFTGFSMLLQSGDAQQRIDKLSFVAPPGLSGYLSNVPLCPEPQAQEGTCPPSSQIGHSTVASGPGPYPLTIPQPGNPESPIYLTGPSNGTSGCTSGTAGCAPFGLTIVTHVIAGPFNLGNVITRAKIEINPYTTQITVTTGALPQVIDGVPTDLRLVDAVIDKPDFMINPTNCDSSSFSGTANGAPPPGSSGPGATAAIGSHFQVGSCQSLKFAPKFAVSTQGKTSKADGASLHVNLTYPSGTPGTYSNVQRVKVELPKILPSRLTTLQKACTAAQFEANPAGCPAASIIGMAKATTPILPVPLVGPAYFVSHGGEAFPSLIMVLQGYGVTFDLVGTTFISKSGITSSTFKSVPDQPVGSFELTLPEGPFSALAANGNFCTEKSSLKMPTEFVAQNGSTFSQTTTIVPTGCKPAITVTSHKVKGKTATLQVSVPAAGKLAAVGTDLSKGAAKISKAGTVSVKLTLTKAGESLLKKHKGRKLEAKIHLTFTPKKGAKLKTSVKVLIG